MAPGVMDGTTDGATGVFRLHADTPDTWAPAAAMNIGELLSDHAHCELKAAASAMTLLRRNVHRPGLALALAGLVREETEHLHRVVRELTERGEALRPDAPSPYAEGLHRAAADTRRGGDPYLDALMVSTLIELRSHERFTCLIACDALATLHPLYRALEQAEARHGEMFVDLARQAFPDDLVEARFVELADAEAAVIGAAPFGHRVHSGPPGPSVGR